MLADLHLDLDSLPHLEKLVVRECNLHGQIESASLQVLEFTPMSYWSPKATTFTDCLRSKLPMLRQLAIHFTCETVQVRFCETDSSWRSSYDAQMGASLQRSPCFYKLCAIMRLEKSEDKNSIMSSIAKLDHIYLLFFYVDYLDLVSMSLVRKLRCTWTVRVEYTSLIDVFLMSDVLAGVGRPAWRNLAYAELEDLGAATDQIVQTSCSPCQGPSWCSFAA